MANGYAGKILKIDLTKKEIGKIDTSQYEEFAGGIGIASAIFWDLAVVPGDWDLQDAFDPRNVISLMSGPLAATGVPGAGRTSVSAIAPETYPTPLFHRTSMGGRFATMLKLAGWDGVVVQGKAERPVWINIINDKVTIEDAKSLWGLNTYETQGQILSMVSGRTRFGEEWQQIGDDYTTARPQIVCIGPVGESMTRVAALIHGSGVSARTGGFGGVFGSKNLKAISVIGTGSIKAADPQAIVDMRIAHLLGGIGRGGNAGASSCMPCVNSDRKRDSYYGGESMCADEFWFMGDRMKGADVAIKWGICTWATKFGGAMDNKVPNAPALFKGKVPMEPGMGWYIKYLYELGVLGPGKKIESYPLPMNEWDKLTFREVFCDAIARKVGIGKDLAEGTFEAAKRWGRLEKDLNSGALRFPAYGASWHHALPGVDWAYSYIFMSGDPMWHGFMGVSGGFGGGPPKYTAEQLVEMLAAKATPFTGDPLMFSNCWKGEEARKTGVYSEHKAKMVAWARRYAGFYNESMAICEMMLPNFIGASANGIAGASPEMEYRYYQAVTGSKNTFADTIETGRKIWNMERAIRVMAGRHRDKEQFAPFMYMPGATFMSLGAKPVYQDGKWSFEDQGDLYLDKAGVELFKTNFYKLEGWDAKNGWPTRKTLEGLNMKKVADLMASRGKLGA
jgi:aldehyde:ferredoxin oxidoreductase